MRTITIILALAPLASAADPKPKSEGTPHWLVRVRLEVERKVNEGASDQELRKELLRRRDEEQQLRFRMIEAMKNAKGGQAEAELTEQLNKADRANRDWLKGVIEKKGWPGRAMVGFDGSDAAWLLVQHADPDPVFQKQALKLLEEAVKRKDARPSHVAYLTDRVLTGEGKKQVFGTQFTSEGGKLEPRPIEDEANVDRRRAEVGLPPLAEYRKQIEKLYGK